MGKSYSHIVPVLATPQRLQEYGVGLFSEIRTKSALKKALKKELIQINGEIATTATMIKGGESILFTPLEVHDPGKTLNLDLKVLFEDDYLAAILKPAGILVSGNSFRTIANSLPQNLQNSEQIDAVTPQPVHRLDFATTGILLVGKTAESIRRLNRMFENKEIDKTYYAVTIGAMEAQGTIKEPIGDKEAITHFEKEATMVSPRFDYLNLVKLHPKTGRRHQLRIHMATQGNPILGDKDYTPEHYILRGKGMYLHASSLEFHHPFTNERLTITAPLPKRFAKLFNGRQDLDRP
ncbi:RluA family pseudouridine synthase [Aureitalea sp. L0-47]|uniref:RluA family pseudouridine synthase n=1 Tax=Aureitalea sp. L0-47 TaxID=2816962 RepID=UPI002238ECE0|nr:RluA family pseudouridine synthase [Aureitalea sp. L0-47]MCW5518521.1 RluA family pseudouridine synthase [Aureitalea sp. L0-47]